MLPEFLIPLRDGRVLTTHRVADHMLVRLDGSPVATVPADMPLSEWDIVIRRCVQDAKTTILGSAHLFP